MSTLLVTGNRITTVYAITGIISNVRSYMYMNVEHREEENEEEPKTNKI